MFIAYLLFWIAAALAAAQTQLRQAEVRLAEARPVYEAIRPKKEEE